MINKINTNTMKEIYRLNQSSVINLIKRNERWMVGLQFNDMEYLLTDRGNKIRLWVDADRAINFIHDKLSVNTAKILIKEENVK